MKKKVNLIILICLIFMSFKIKAQQNDYNNYYYYTQKMDNYYDSIIEKSPDTVKIPGLVDYQRQKEFWSTRVYNCDTIIGDYSKYTEQLKKYIQNPSMAPSKNTTNTWEFVGPKNLSSHNNGIIVSLYIDPTDINKILAGTNNSGMFRTTNGGQNWVNVTDNISMSGMGVNDIAVNPNNPNEIYIATGNNFNNYGLGIFKTTDNCNSWQQVLSFDPKDRIIVRKLLIDSENPSIIYALANKYVYRTKDAGNSWEMIFNELTIPNWWDKNKYLIDVEIKPNDHNTLYIASVGIGSGSLTYDYSAEIWKTHTAKANNVTWQRIENGLPDYVDRYALETDSQNPDKLYIAYTVPGNSSYTMSFFLKEADYPNYQLQNIYEKLNYYNSYSSHLAGTGYWRFEIEISPANSDIMFIGGYNLDVLNLATNQIIKYHHVSSGSNASFHVDQRIFKTTLLSGKTYLFCGNDGGVSKYNYSDDILESINGQGLDNLQYFGIGNCDKKSGFFIGGTQDNGEIGNGTDNWIRTNVGDSYENIIDPVETNIVYCTSNGGIKNVNKSNNSAVSFINITLGLSFPINEDYGLNDRPFVMSPQDRNTLYIGYHEVYKTTNGGSYWQQFTNFHNSGFEVNNAIRTIALSQVSSNYMYVCYTDPTWVASGIPRLFRTNDGGANWTDITPNLASIFKNHLLTDIVISDRNPTNVWVSFGGFHENNGNAINRVLFSTNSGSTWTDITANLPNLPINCLKSIDIDNSTHILAGTDIGVFIYDSQQNSWINISNGLPPVSVTDIEINYTESEIRIATFGRGIWKTKMPCSLFSGNPHIYVSQVWNTGKILENTLYIEPNVTLEIKSSVGVAKDAGIIVMPGAELILNGGKITSGCDDYWSGIEVRGDASQHQYDIGGSCAQGKVILKNGAIIENAWKGVLLGSTNGANGYNSDENGGILRVIGNRSLTEPAASFINNRWAVEFQEYQNYNPANPSEIKPNVSYLSNAHFEVNGNYFISPVWGNYDTHVKVYGVDGVSFRGCTFTNQTGSKNNGTGIYVAPGPAKFLNCGIKISAVCTSEVSPCPEESLDKCTFENLENGISANNTGIGTVTVEDAIFDNNSYGIKLSTVNNVSVLFSEFYLGDTPADEEEECGSKASSYGIYMDNCTGFAIEENEFHKKQGAPAGNYTGIRIDNTEAADEVYKNYFEGLSYANYATGKNWLGTNTWQGLAYYCNDNEGNWQDFTVANIPNQSDGIQNPIGLDEMPAGNTFSENANSNIYNDGDFWIGYFYYAPTQGNTNTPCYPDEVYRVTPAEVVGIKNECPSHYGGGGSGGDDRELVLSPGEKSEAEQVFADNLANYNNVKVLYDNLKDGGNTEQLKSEVETAWPDDMWELRAELLGKSPHLSMEVLKKTADKTDVLPESIIFEIMAANPDELKKEELIKYLQDKDNPLPGYMIDILKQVAMGTTYKTVLQRQMAYFNQVKTMAANDIIRSLLNDTILDINELRNWLDNIGGKRADEQIIASYLQEGNYTDALAMANMMPAIYNYKDDEITEHNYYITLLTLRINLLEEGRTLFDLDSLEVNNLEYIADNSVGTAGAQARGILEFAYGHHFCNCLNISDTSGYKSSNSFNYESFNKAFGPEIDVNPNPASDWVTFDYILPDDKAEGIIKISDVNGKVIETIFVSGRQGQKVWDTRKVNQGVYLYSFIVNGISKTGKIIITK